MSGENQDDRVRVSKRTFLSRVARRSGYPVDAVKGIYQAMVAELLEIMRAGDTLMLTGFGKFYPQPHHGHRVQFAKEADGAPRVIDDYTVLKFSATRDINRTLGDEDD